MKRVILALLIMVTFSSCELGLLFSEAWFRDPNATTTTTTSTTTSTTVEVK